jgi:hypothetical protein
LWCDCEAAWVPTTVSKALPRRTMVGRMDGGTRHGVETKTTRAPCRSGCTGGFDDTLPTVTGAETEHQTAIAPSSTSPRARKGELGGGYRGDREPGVALSWAGWRGSSHSVFFRISRRRPCSGWTGRRQTRDRGSCSCKAELVSYSARSRFISDVDLIPRGTPQHPCSTPPEARLGRLF